MRLKVMRDKIAWFIASKEGKKSLTEGVTDDNFYDYGAYVNLIAKSLRRMASDRSSYLTTLWRQPPDWMEWDREQLESAAKEETALLNKWADILEADIDDEPYYDPFWDHISGMKIVRHPDGGGTMEFPPISPGAKKVESDYHAHEEAIHALQADILMELGENFRYMWD